MKTSHSVGSALLAVLIGFQVGKYVAGHDCQRAVRLKSVENRADSADETMSRLDLLRRGDTNALMQSLDVQLDRQSMMLQELLEEFFPEARRNTNAVPLLGRAVRILERARAFRAAHPRVATLPNEPAAGKAGITACFTIERQWPGLPEPGRSP
jgi:hypothetical protein